MFLHHDVELFREIINSTSAEFQIPVAVVEKDYYVTLILRELSKSSEECVFKGGTSLSKGHHVINRFSEDIDISFSSALTQGQRKDLKYKTIALISSKLEMPISDWNTTRSRRDYNCYTFTYKPLAGFVPESLIQGVKMEVTLSMISFPTVLVSIDSYVYRYLSIENADIAEQFDLLPFKMKVQSLERTLIDKVFAICDYYLSGNIKRNSRHLYDIYMVWPKIKKVDGLKALIKTVRSERQHLKTCLSASNDIDIPSVLHEIVSLEIYKNDYESVTSYFQQSPLPYEEAIKSLVEIEKSGLF